MKQEVTEFNREECFEKNIQETVEELVLKLKHYNLPFGLVVAVKNSKDATKYVIELNGAVPMGLRLADDKFPEIINVMRGFQTIPPAEMTEMEMDGA